MRSRENVLRTITKRPLVNRFSERYSPRDARLDRYRAEHATRPLVGSIAENRRVHRAVHSSMSHKALLREEFGHNSHLRTDCLFWPRWASNGSYNLQPRLRKLLDTSFTPDPLLVLKGKFSDSEPLYQRSLAIREEALGPEHPEVALSLNELAGLLCSQVITLITRSISRLCLRPYGARLFGRYPRKACSLTHYLYYGGP